MGSNPRHPPHIPGPLGLNKHEQQGFGILALVFGATLDVEGKCMGAAYIIALLRAEGSS